MNAPARPGKPKHIPTHYFQSGLLLWPSEVMGYRGDYLVKSDIKRVANPQERDQVEWLSGFDPLPVAHIEPVRD